MNEHYIPLKMFHKFIATIMTFARIEYFTIDKERALFQFLGQKFITFRIRK